MSRDSRGTAHASEQALGADSPWAGFFC